MANIDIKKCQDLVNVIGSNVKKVIVGKDQQILLLLTSWIAGGHVLIEDIPGTGKTILVRALAKSVSSKFSRVQFTPDLLPSDILGASIFNQVDHSFEFRPGPVFTTILLADEINRATPRTQSALLECMSEGQVTVEGVTHGLSPLFFTVATQNPVEQLGTFTLPEAQMDRFFIQMSMGYPGAADEVQLAKNQNESHPVHSLQPVATDEEIKWLRDQIKNVKISEEIYQFVVKIMNKSREHEQIKLGCSPRATLALLKCCQVLSLINGYEYVRPEIVQQMMVPVMSHRIILTSEAKMSGRTSQSVIESIVKQVSVPIRAA